MGVGVEHGAVAADHPSPLQLPQTPLAPGRAKSLASGQICHGQPPVLLHFRKNFAIDGIDVRYSSPQVDFNGKKR